MQHANGEKRKIVRKESVQMELLPVRYEDIEVVRSKDSVTVFCRGICFFTFNIEDRSSRNYSIVQLHLAGKIKLKRLSVLFGLGYQHCSNIVVRYKREGLEGILERTERRYGNRKIIDERIGELILDYKGRGISYKEIAQVVRFRFKKRIKYQSIRSWVHRKNKISNVSEQKPEQSDFFETEDKQENAGEWHWNGYCGSMILYAMIEWSGFLKPFEEYIYEDESKKKSGWGVRRVLLTLFFLHALRCKSIEQTKHLVGKDFKELVGGDFLRLQCLRYAIDDIVSEPGFDKAIDAYYKDLMGLTNQDDGIYYTDGHFSTYYGKRSVPKGYDPRRNQPYRGRNAVYMHNSQGEIVYLFESPTNTTLSNDIEKLLNDVEDLGMELKRKTLLFDRGGYSQKCFKFIRCEKKMYFVSYLKNRKKEREIEESKFQIYKIKTEEGKEEEYKIFEKEKRETRYGTVRIIVLLTNDGKQIPILTTNPYLKKEEVVCLLKRRWREENCFKYMIEHFGIDLLTTYKTESAPDKIIERVNPKRKEINRKISQKKKELEKLQSELAKKLVEKGNHGESTVKEFMEVEKELEFAIKNTQVDIDYLIRLREGVPAKIKVNLRDECVIIAQKRRLLINAVKAMNFNSEKWLQVLFKKHHFKIDETLSLIRSLWRHPGRIRSYSRQVDVMLEKLDIKAQRESLNKILEKLKDNKGLRLPDGRILNIFQTH